MRRGGSRAPERLGLFGGSFDPVHFGHLHAARAALEAFDLKRVLFIPAARPPHKPDHRLAPAADRVAMLAIALGGEPRFEIDPLELERAGPSYTIDTVHELRARYASKEPELFLIIGSDNLPGLASWWRAEELLANVQPIIVHREGDPAELLHHLRGRLSDPALTRLERGFLRIEPVVVAASELRDALRAGRDPGDALPFGVFDYIRARRLYADLDPSP